mgnify:CR=1 FL=1
MPFKGGGCMKFVDRSNEIAALEREYQRDGASMFILYGRRRVGKTELIRHFILKVWAGKRTG